MSIPTPTVRDTETPLQASGTPMPPSHIAPHHARRLLLGIAGIAIVGDLTLRITPWGLNFVLWTGVLVAGAWFTIKHLVQAPPHESLVWLGGAITFASFFAWRDAVFLSVWNLAAVFAALSLATLRLGGSDSVRASVGTVTSTVFRTVRSLGGGAVPLAANDMPWKTITGERKAFASHALGLALAIPALLVFGSLFSSADPVFHALVVKMFDAVALDLETVVSHGVLMAILAWLCAGYLRSLFRASTTTEPLRQLKGTLGTSAILIPLSTIAFLFLVFVGIQVGYLFGGDVFVRQTTGLTYAQYARRGFFELVAAAGLVLPLLLMARWAINTSELARRSYKAVAIALLLLVDLVTISAILRMRLYTVAFGLTQDRLYATALMFWIGFLLAWFAATAMRDKPGFAFGSLISGFALLATLNIVNPDGLIVRANVARVGRGESLDVSYLNSLSDDAVPALVSAWGRFDPAQRCELRNGVIDREQRRKAGWQSWNLGRWRAARARQRLANTGTLTPACTRVPTGDNVIE